MRYVSVLVGISAAALGLYAVAYAAETKTFTPSQRNWWAFRPLAKRALPAVKNHSWSYGVGESETAVYGTNCLLARRLVERGVRFVEVYSGSRSRWDAHNNLESNHTENCKSSDKPVAGLLADLKSRGMLNDTLVVWGGEFGRTPFVQGKPDDEPHHVHDLHASILYLLGLGHLRTTYLRDGRAERPTGTGGALITKLWA